MLLTLVMQSQQLVMVWGDMVYNTSWLTNVILTIIEDSIFTVVVLTIGIIIPMNNLSNIYSVHL